MNADQSEDLVQTQHGHPVRCDGRWADDQCGALRHRQAYHAIRTRSCNIPVAAHVVRFR